MPSIATGADARFYYILFYLLQYQLGDPFSMDNLFMNDILL